MISYLSGKIKFVGINFVILDVVGVGYKIFLPAVFLTQKAKVGRKAKFFIYHYLREDISDLYGFENYQDLELFELLISVSGVGPKVGMMILSRAQAKKIKEAIVSGNTEVFTAITNIGPKLATRICTELRNKISSEDLGITPSRVEYGEVTEALKELGYRISEIRQVLVKMPKNLKNSSDQLKWALRQLSK